MVGFRQCSNCSCNNNSLSNCSKRMKMRSVGECVRECQHLGGVEEAVGLMPCWSCCSEEFAGHVLFN